MAKFKVGDKVRVKKNLIPGKVYGNVSFVPSMRNMCGKIVTIKDFYFDNCNMYLKEIGYLWSPEMLEPVKEDNPLLKENNVVLTPHSAALTKESSIEMSSMTASGILAICKGKKWNHVANPDVFNS